MTLRFKTLNFSIVLAFAILSLSIAYAQTMVAGKIYNSDYSSTIAGASIEVRCGSSFLNTLSLSDGTYAVRFEQSECTLGYNAIVSSEKGDLAGSGSGTIIDCKDSNCYDNYFVIVNLAAKHKAQGDSSGSSYGPQRLYLCGNGKCDSGETVNTCPQDCKKAEPTAQAAPEETSSAQIQEITKKEITQQAFTQNNGLFAAIIGAVSGTLGTAGSIIAIIFLVGIICAVIAVSSVRKIKSH